MLAQVDVLGHGVLLIADVALQIAELDRVVDPARVGAEEDVDVDAGVDVELGEGEQALPRRLLDDGRDAGPGVTVGAREPAPGELGRPRRLSAALRRRPRR